MVKLGPITDPTYTAPGSWNALDRFFLRYIRDERDLPFIHLSLRITFSLIPLGILLYLPFVTGWWWVLAAVAYQYVNNVTYKGPFGLMLHCTSHRPRAKRAELAAKPDYVNDVLNDGARRARAIAKQTMEEVREAIQLP